MPRSQQLLLLAALFAARPGSASEQQQGHGGLLKGLAKAAAGAAAKAAAGAAAAKKAAGSQAAGTNASLEGAAKAADTGSAAAKLYSVNEARAFAAMAKLAYCGPGPVPLAPYGSSPALPGLIAGSCGAFCENAGFKLGQTRLVTKPAYGQKNAEFAYVSKIVPVKAGRPAIADCAVVFRGTWVNPANTDTNTNSTLVNFTSPSCETGCQVVGGAYQVWKDLQHGVMVSLGQLGCGMGATVAVTGHSLGGQVASIAMFFLQDQLGYKVALSYTFEQPKPFNKKAAQTFETLFPDRAVSYFRITNANDQVTRYPISTDIYQPGFQVWYTSFDDDNSYTLCGTQLAAPDCGTLSIPKKKLCRMSNNNPADLECGGYAPYNGPHCRSALAPAQSICDFAGNSKTMFLTESVATCMMGTPMKAQAVGPTEVPPVFPPPASDASVKPSTTVASLAPMPAPVDLHQKTVTGSDGEDCFKNNTASSPLSMFGHYIQTVDSVQACQQRCADTAYCEMFTYYSYEGAGGKGGGCEITGGWGQYVPGILGSTAGPKDCSKTPPQLDDGQKFALLQEYMQFIGTQYDPHYGLELQYERRDGGAGLAGPRGFSLASVACIGAGMLVLGAGAGLLAARTTRRAGLLGLRPSAARRDWATADELGLVASSE